MRVVSAPPFLPDPPSPSGPLWGPPTLAPWSAALLTQPLLSWLAMPKEAAPRESDERAEQQKQEHTVRFACGLHAARSALRSFYHSDEAAHLPSYRC